MDFTQMDTATLVVTLQQTHDEAGFVELCQRFKPLFYQQNKKFANLNFTMAELQQEMHLILFDCLQKFQAVGYQQTFGAYLKRMLQHRLLDQWRRQHTRKAVFYQESSAIVDEDATNHEYLQNNICDNVNYHADSLLELRETLTEFADYLKTDLERSAYYALLHGTEVRSNGEITQVQIKRAQSRVRKKLEDYLD